MEVTLEEVHAHLGVESQRQWSALAITRTTPALFALFSIVVTLAHEWQSKEGFNLPKAAWYHKSQPTFADALALVRQRLWLVKTFQTSGASEDVLKVPRQLFNTWSDLLCYAA